MIDEFIGITSEKYPIPKMMKAWVLGDPEQFNISRQAYRDAK